MPSSFGTHHVQLVSTFLCLDVEIIVGAGGLSWMRERQVVVFVFFCSLFFYGTVTTTTLMMKGRRFRRAERWDKTVLCQWKTKEKKFLKAVLMQTFQKKNIVQGKRTQSLLLWTSFVTGIVQEKKGGNFSNTRPLDGKQKLDALAALSLSHNLQSWVPVSHLNRHTSQSYKGTQEKLERT